MRTATLRRQHDTALRIADEIVAEARNLAERPDRSQALKVTLLLARLTGLLRIHFAQEDRGLYPSLMASGRSGVAQTARRFFEEMGKIGPAYEAFVTKWSNVDTMVAAPAGFQTEAAMVFAALADRIERENMILYPLIDAEQNAADGSRAA